MKPLWKLQPQNMLWEPLTLNCSFRLVNGNPAESFLCIGNSARKHVTDFSQEGLRTSVGYALGYLSMTKCIDGELWLTSKENPQTIGDIDTKAHMRKKDGWELCIFSGIELLHALHIIAWAHQDRFVIAHGIFSAGARICTICGKTQHGDIVGHNNMGTINPIYHWPAETCTDPDCLSHALDEAIDPTYQAPRDELRALCEAEKNRKNEFDESIQQALEKAGLLPLKSLGDR